MSEPLLPVVRSWLAAPMEREVSAAIERLQRAPDVRHIAVMPDVHLAADVCIGVAVATSHLLYPQAVGGDIGCGILAVQLDVDAAAFADAKVAGQILNELRHVIPARRRNRRASIALPHELSNPSLSDAGLNSLLRNEGVLEFATLGSGNHFVEIQVDEDDHAWLMVHSGSRAIGQAIRNRHVRRSQVAGSGFRALDAFTAEGREYLDDVVYARGFADASRKAIANEIGVLLGRILRAQICWDTLITTDHNHVSLERHGDRDLWVHRKGAMRADCGALGVLPGSMGSCSFHVAGRGCENALCSSAHGAGRALSRAEAFRQVSERDLRRQMEGIWYDYRMTNKLRDEAPSAYKDIRTVLRAQKELVKVIRTLRPVLNYKGT